MRTELKTRKRLAAVMAAMSLLFALVGIRIGDLTLVEGEALTARGVRQWTREGVVAARRGSVVDSEGRVLAMSATAYQITVNPQTVKDPEALARILAPLIGISEETIAQRAARKGVASVILKRQASRETVDAIRALRQTDESAAAALRGVSFDEDVRRWYPRGAFLTQVLGLTNVEQVGQSGLEMVYEDTLRGVPGVLKTEVDARARLLPDGKTSYIPAQSGHTLQLTVNADIQAIVEKAARECLEVNQARAVQCVVMDPNTGAVLAMCMKPDYDLNDPPRNDVEKLQELMRITAVTDVYEPGSTLKMLTCAAALDSENATVDSPFTCTGSIRVDGDTIRCWKKSHGHQTLREGLANSCNPVFVTLALRMGTDTLYRYLEAFGLGRRTGIGLPGESGGLLISRKNVRRVDLARIGFGQSVAVTPIQLLTAACAVVNGGRLMKPYVVQGILDERGDVLESTLPQVVAQPIREETSAVMRDLLLNVVENGGGKNGGVEGYRVGGKTGTAQVYKDGRVARDVHIGSFIGFAPMDAPRIAVLLTVHEAQVPVDYGSTTAAPFARQILEEALPCLGIEKTQPDATAAPDARVPDVTGLSLKEAKKVLAQSGFLCENDGQSDRVTAQAPAAGATLTQGGRVMLYTYEQTPVQAMELVSVPDVRGMSVTEASRVLRARGFVMKMEGSGLACGQSLGADTFAPPGAEITVTFRLPDHEED